MYKPEYPNLEDIYIHDIYAQIMSVEVLSMLHKHLHVTSIFEVAQEHELLGTGILNLLESNEAKHFNNAKVNNTKGVTLDETR